MLKFAKELVFCPVDNFGGGCGSTIEGFLSRGPWVLAVVGGDVVIGFAGVTCFACVLDVVLLNFVIFGCCFFKNVCAGSFYEMYVRLVTMLDLCDC